MTLQERMMHANNYIRQARFDEARSLLKTVPTDEAREWLRRIDQMTSSRKQETPTGQNV